MYSVLPIVTVEALRFGMFPPTVMREEPFEVYRIPSAMLRANSPAEMYCEFVEYEAVVFGVRPATFVRFT
jgi:hypothetical protein